MSLYLRLAWRNVWRHRRRTLLIVLAIGMTLTMMMWYDGIVAGFNNAIYGNAIKVLGGNLQIHGAGYSDQTVQNPLIPLADDNAVVKAALAQPQVVAASKRITTGGLVSNREGAFGVTIVGIEPEKELPVSLVGQKVSAGKFLTAGDQDVIYIGKGLADELGAAVGDRITLAGLGTHEQMRSRTMTIGGIFNVGMPDIEKITVYVSLGEAQDLYGLPGQSTGVMVSLKQIGQEYTVMDALKPSLTNVEMDPWQIEFPDLQSALSSKGKVMDIFSIVILLIVGIGILNLLLMAVFERTREIGLLGAIGFKPGQISLLFLLEGAMMALVGVVFGVALGLATNMILGHVGMDFGSFSGVSDYMALITTKVYPSLGTEKLLQRVVTAVVISLLASYYPAREASHSEPAKALHFV
jgi:ABC-type lipoprotein release transport system permease subunit